MFTVIFCSLTSVIWLLCRLGNPNFKAWKVRNFIGKFSFFAGFLGAAMASKQDSIGAGLVMGVAGWLACTILIGGPVTLLYYLIKLRKLDY